MLWFFSDLKQGLGGKLFTSLGIRKLSVTESLTDNTQPELRGVEHRKWGLRPVVAQGY